MTAPYDPQASDLHEYRARFQPAAGNAEEGDLTVTVDRTEETITYRVFGQSPVTVDPPTARALSMLLRDAVYFSISPVGPTVHTERDTGDGRGWIKA